MLLSGLLGSETAEKVLLYLENYTAGYPRGIAQTYDLPVSQIQRQLERFEREGVLVSRTREYVWNPRYLFRNEIEALLKKALKNLPKDYQDKYFRERTRPRRKGKPLP